MQVLAEGPILLLVVVKYLVVALEAVAEVEVAAGLQDRVVE